MKKILAALTALTLVFSMSMGVLAAGAMKDIDTVNFSAAMKANGDNKLIKLDDTFIAADKLSDLTVEAGSELKIYLTDTMFVDSAGTRVNTDLTKAKYVTRAQVRDAKVTLRRSTSKGKDAFQSVGIKYDKTGAYIGIQFVDTFTSTEDLDFGVTLYLYINDRRRDATKLSIYGTLTTDDVAVYNDTEYVDLQDGQYAEAMERIIGIEVDTGNGLSIFMNMTRGRKYAATSSNDLSNADIRVTDKYPYITSVYTLKTVNVKSANPKVMIYTDTKQYAYDANGKYLGTTDKRLAYSTKYYVSDKKYDSINVK